MSKIINFSDEISNLLPLQFDSDTADVNELASLQARILLGQMHTEDDDSSYTIPD